MQKFYPDNNKKGGPSATFLFFNPDFAVEIVERGKKAIKTGV